MSAERNQQLHAYKEAGFRLVKVRAGEKRPSQKEWTKRNLEPESIAHDENVGLIFENGFVDLDFDTPEARKLSGWFFGDCPSFRRASLAPGQPGHRIVHAKNHPGGKVVFALADEDAKLMGKANILELRSSTSKRHHQTVVPPSRYIDECWRDISGRFQKDAPHDELVWDVPFNKESVPSREWEDVHRSGALLALASLALKNYPPEGKRDGYCMKLAGALLDQDMDVENVDQLVEHIAELAGDEERRTNKGSNTARRAEDGVQVSGLSSFLGLFGSKTLEKTVRQWFGEKVRNSPSGAGKNIPAPPDAICLYSGRHTFRTLLERALIAKGVQVYRRFDMLVTPVTLKDAFTDDAGVTYAKDTVLLKEVNAAWVRFTCDEFGIVFCDLKGNLTTPNLSYFEDLFVKVEDSAFPSIDGVSTTPTIGRNEPGYDPVSRRVLVFSKDTFPDAPLTPTKDEALAALARLREPVQCYRWAHDYDESVWCAAMVAGTVRSEMPDCPMFAFNARHASSGKTILADCVAQNTAGGEPATMSWTGNHAENAKKLFSTLMCGATVLFIDNVPDGMTMDSDTLNQMITHQTYQDRVLGLSKIATVSTRVLIMATGNNMRVSGDLVSRTCMATVEPPSPRPEELSYDFDPAEMVKRNRGQFVVDCLTIVRAYVAAGRPGEAQLPACRLKGFNLIRGALTWLGMPDPHKGIQDLRDESNETEQRYRLFLSLVQLYEPGKTFRAWALADDETVVTMVGGKKDEGDPAKRIGRLLSRHRDLDVGGITLKAKQDSSTKTLVWWYEITDPEANEQLWADAKMKRALTEAEQKDAREREHAAYQARTGS